MAVGMKDAEEGRMGGSEGSVHLGWGIEDFEGGANRLWEGLPGGAGDFLLRPTFSLAELL